MLKMTFFKKVSRVFHDTFKGVSDLASWAFLACVKEVSWTFQERFKAVLFLSCNSVVAWLSSQLSKQKESLFFGPQRIGQPQNISIKIYQSLPLTLK